jgi:hypothetical protein
MPDLVCFQGEAVCPFINEWFSVSSNRPSPGWQGRVMRSLWELPEPMRGALNSIIERVVAGALSSLIHVRGRLWGGHPTANAPCITSRFGIPSMAPGRSRQWGTVPLRVSLLGQRLQDCLRPMPEGLDGWGRFMGGDPGAKQWDPRQQPFRPGQRIPVLRHGLAIARDREPRDR